MKGVPRSLELLGERGLDPTPDVYARMFARWPETERLFARDHDGSVRGHMLFEVIEAVLDLAGDGQYARGLIAAERVHHTDDLQVSDAQYEGLFAILRDVVRDRLGDGWTGEMESGWAGLLEAIAAAR